MSLLCLWDSTQRGCCDIACGTTLFSWQRWTLWIIPLSLVSTRSTVISFSALLVWLSWYPLLTQTSSGRSRGIKNWRVGSRNVDSSVEEPRNLPSWPQDNTRIGILCFHETISDQSFRASMERYFLQVPNCYSIHDIRRAWAIPKYGGSSIAHQDIR